MQTRREFFEVEVNFPALEEHSRSSDSSIRWASAIELGQLGTEEAISLLWSLTTDSDEHVRDAANLGLQSCDQKLVGKVLASKWSTPTSIDDATASDGIAEHVSWKIRPLEIPSSENEWLVDAAILNIIQIEGPLTGSRLLRLYGNAAFPTNPRKISNSRIQTAVNRLMRRNLIGVINDNSSKDLEFWTLYKLGSPEIIIRSQGQRRLNEIPVTEVIARVRSEMGDEFDFAGQNEKFACLQRVYGIKQAELYKVGEVLTNEWAAFLA
jgi:hypothetical protein